jgi:hypothetical protein
MTFNTLRSMSEKSPASTGASIEYVIPGTLQERFLTLHADTIDHVGAIRPFLDHLEDDLGGILQVRIDDDHGIAVGIVQSSSKGGLMAEVARQQHGLDPRVVFGKVRDYLGRTVRAAIINKNDLQTKIPVPQHLDEPLIGQRDDILFIEAGNDDR